jgi:4-hydroxy-3-methylbut-2-en-1-yl diphosphate reductase
MKKFDIPTFYQSPIISRVKALRKDADPRKKDFTPSVLDFGPVKFLIARHFGFCYGVENAIEIAYKAVSENPDKRIFLLSEMIHNPDVNQDLLSRGISFIMDTIGNQLIPWDSLNPDDIVIVPAFGTTVEIEQKLSEIGITIATYDTTCPFVQKVWKRAESLGSDNHTIIVHGKYNHEETRATFSHSRQNAPTLIVRDMADTQQLADIITGKLPIEEFSRLFAGKYSEGFDPTKDLQRIGVVNQTTMLATETQAIADRLRSAMLEKYGEASIQQHFADTRDTLCYATNDNQRATYGLLEAEADIAIIVGGYNSSNTSHIVELCEEKYPSYFISSADKIISDHEISHFDYHHQQHLITMDFLPKKAVTTIILTSGASCPDAMVDAVMQKLISFFPEARDIESVMASHEQLWASSL